MQNIKISVLFISRLISIKLLQVFELLCYCFRGASATQEQVLTRASYVKNDGHKRNTHHSPNTAGNIVRVRPDI